MLTAFELTLARHACTSVRRGLFTVLDRDGLIGFAGGTYGQAEAEYRRLIGAPF